MTDAYRWSLLTACLLGLAVAINHGRWSVPAFAVLCVALVVIAAGFFRDARSTWNEGNGPRAFVLGLLATMAVTGLFDRTVIPEAASARWWLGRVAQGGSLLLLATYFRPRSGRVDRLRFGAFAVLLAVAGTAAIRLDPTPDIDVWTIETRGVEVLLEGKNPYVWASVPDTDPETDFTVPYVYPPTSLYVGLMGRLVGGDVRYALLGALLAAGFALRFIARNSGSPLTRDAPALALWLSPPLFFVLDRSWIDPVQIALICLGIAAFSGNRKTLAAVLLGLAISSKQSMFWLVPLCGIILAFDLRRWVVMGASALIPVVPFLLWDFRSLKFANFDFMSRLPPRHDGLCVTSWVYHAFGGKAFPSLLSFVLAATVVLFSLRKRGAAFFAQAALATYFVFFFFNRWAFANYYFLCIGLAALVAATSAPGKA